MATTSSFSNRQRARATEPVSFWRENEIAVVILLQVRMTTSPRDAADFVFLKSRKGVAIILQNNYVKLVAHKELNETSKPGCIFS